MTTQPMDIQAMSYEEAVLELESIIDNLENSQQPLELVMTQFERGQALAARCAALLDQADLRVRQVSGIAEDSDNASGSAQQ